ncbi:MBL fold metallo-hydrolase [Massilia endophytica]|uniref:MBL fold metallo-hydrolase n=1 Tax=Massilia endophytica TaxID=2899220 RepID=UPI001E57EC89|nr:MBL fold metallo-hydrolase [Massilia endophytica]UGQ48770.1 MBL fold metallo-hydrolase [Massilia endophytica]
MFALSGLAQAAPPLVLQPVQVSKHVWFFQGSAGMASQGNKGFMSNAGFVVTGDGVVVFDALATPALGEAMAAAIRRITPKPIRRVIVSHYHADHFYGLQALKAQGAEIWAHEKGRATLESDDTKRRLEQRMEALAPWVNKDTKLIAADRWLALPPGGEERFEMGGVHFRVIDASGAHSPEDLMLYVEEGRVLFAGDLFFTGRIPFVGNADSASWLNTLDRMLATNPGVVIPGHGARSLAPKDDMMLTREYLRFLRKTMGDAVANMTTFDEAYRATDWGRFKDYPAFEQANRINAYETYLRMEQESLSAH